MEDIERIVNENHQQKREEQANSTAEHEADNFQEAIVRYIEKVGQAIGKERKAAKRRTILHCIVYCMLLLTCCVAIASLAVCGAMAWWLAYGLITGCFTGAGCYVGSTYERIKRLR